MKHIKFGHTVSEETRKKISNTLKGNIPWNKGVSTNRPRDITTGRFRSST